ncbi:MAG: CAP domain-containing protein [Ferruginibacter sp.]
MKNPLFLKFLFFLNIFITLYSVSVAQELSSDESELYDLVMAYRKAKGLPHIPLSRSLTIVAQTHVKDLEENYQRNSSCNFHSWSNQGKWKAVCYTDNHARAKLMWSKPQELTAYKGYGFEIAFAIDEAYLANAADALESWRSSRPHNAVMLNKDKWKRKWNAIGIGIYGSYAVIWFGNEPDK